MGIGFLQTPARNPMPHQGPVKGLGKIFEAYLEKSDPGILLARYEPGLGQGYERMVLPDGQGVSIGLVEISLPIVCEGKQRFDFGIEREAAAVIRIDDAAGGIESPWLAPRACVGSDHSPLDARGMAQFGRQVDGVPHPKGLGVDQNGSVLFRCDGQRS